MNKTSEISLVCIFAENIRTEATGQSTIIGTYLGKPVELPVQTGLAMPSFAVQCILHVPLDVELKSISLELRLEETSLETVNLPPEAMQAFTRDRAMYAQRDKRMRSFPIYVALQMGNFAIPHPGFLRVLAQVNGQSTWSNALEFVLPATVAAATH